MPYATCIKQSSPLLRDFSLTETVDCCYEQRTVMHLCYADDQFNFEILVEKNRIANLSNPWFKIDFSGFVRPMIYSVHAAGLGGAVLPQGGLWDS